MAYLILSCDGLEWDRRELLGQVVVGRSPECDISVHDILLSRRHCQIIQSDGGWVLIDLASRNGTRVRDQNVEKCRLKHGDVIRVGRTKVTFRADAFMPNPRRTDRPPVPISTAKDETMSGTVVGMPVTAPPVQPVRRVINRPTPKPRPRDPVSFASDNLYDMLEQITSNSWDSIYATNSQPLRRERVLPEPIVAGKRYTVVRQESPLVALPLPAMPVAQTPVSRVMPVAQTPVARVMPVVKAPSPRRTKPGLAEWTRNRLSQLMMRIRPVSVARRAA